MALTAKIRRQFEQTHGMSLQAASDMLADSGSAPCLGEGTSCEKLQVVGRGHPLLDKSVDPEAKHRQNQEILRGW
jgi:hypothetical protein